MRSYLASFVRGQVAVRPADIVRGCVGGLLGVAAAGLLARQIVGGQNWAAPLLVPPIGASAVLVFAVPASPLAQPRAVIGGNVLSALVGVACGLLIPFPALAAAAAVAGAILAMSLFRCLHPPGGAVALGAALAGGAAGLSGFAYALSPVGLCSVLLVAAGALYAPLVGRSYPHRVIAPTGKHDTKDTPPGQRVGYTAADLDDALRHYGELLDVSREDLDVLFRQVETRAHQRLHAKIRCSEVMSRDVLALRSDQSTEDALAFLRRHDLRSAPVIGRDGRLAGQARRAELLAGQGELVGAVLDPLVHRVGPEVGVDALLPLLSTGAAHEAMVVDQDGRLLGIITQTDLLAVLYRAHIVETLAADGALAA